MYWLTPFHYLLEGFLAAVTYDVPVTCDPSELARFPSPPGQSRASYTDNFIAQAGGYVQTGAGGLCELCQYANGDQFAASFNMFYGNIWRDYGFILAYCIFNLAVAFLCSWLHLGGARRIGKAFGLKARNQAKMAGEGRDMNV
jgi:ATP-binding cassette, subfamily G (WHITE), member 2, SNQ2